MLTCFLGGFLAKGYFRVMSLWTPGSREIARREWDSNYTNISYDIAGYLIYIPIFIPSEVTLRLSASSCQLGDRDDTLQYSWAVDLDGTELQ